MSDDIDWGFFVENYEDREIPLLNRLAWYFYRVQGYEVREDFQFHRSTHPQENLMFVLATIAKNFFEDYGGEPIKEIPEDMSEED